MTSSPDHTPDTAPPAELTRILDRLPLFAGQDRQVTELPGGLTNRNLRVVVDSGSYVVRISAGTTVLLAIDRDHEHANSVAAAESGIAPPVVDYRPDLHALVVGYVDGHTLTDDDLRHGDHLTRVAAACRQLHAGPRFVGDFDMFDVQRRYRRIVAEHGFRLAPRYDDFLPHVQRIHAALAVQDVGTVPCHNDLLAGNFIDDGDRLWLIDYEYAGNNDACFELGNIWSEADLSLDQLEELVTAYHGRRLVHKIARARLLGLMSKYGWTLWASIQDGVSQLDFDFWSWGMDKHDRAVAEFDGPDFERLLNEAAATD